MNDLTGKTALVQEVAYRRRKAKAKHSIWETTASRLIKELTRDTGWQDNLSHLVSELTERGDFLFVRNLAELFQVGNWWGAGRELLVRAHSKNRESINTLERDAWRLNGNSGAHACIPLRRR